MHIYIYTHIHIHMYDCMHTYIYMRKCSPLKLLPAFYFFVFFLVVFVPSLSQAAAHFHSLLSARTSTSTCVEEGGGASHDVYLW